MEISEVRVKLVEDAGDRLQGFCSITFDNSFVVRDLKIIEGTNGPFVAMPSRKLTARCPKCGSKNHLRAAYCNQCGGELKDDRVAKDEKGRPRLFADIAHPINAACREKIQRHIISAFREEQEKSKLPGYVSNYDEFDAGDYDEYNEPGGNGALTGKDAGGGVEGKRPGSERTTEVQPPEVPHGPHGGRTAAGDSSRRSRTEQPTQSRSIEGGFGEGIVD